MADLTFEEFCEKSAWPRGTYVVNPDDPTGEPGQIVKRGGQQWTTRDKLPYVRWFGKIDAVQVPWERLTRA